MNADPWGIEAAENAEPENDDAPQIFIGHNRDQSIIAYYSYYRFEGLRLTEAAYNLTEESLARAILDVCHLAHQRAMAHMRQWQLSLGSRAHDLNRRMPTEEAVEELQERIHSTHY